MDTALENFYSLYDRRRSIREFIDRPIEGDVLARLLRVLLRAQSAANRQPWHFVVVEREGRDEFNKLFHKEGFRNAPVVIAALADTEAAWVRKTDAKNYAWVDVSIAVTEMIGAATAEGVGTCWIAAIDPVGVKSILGVPDSFDLVGVIALGYPETELAHERKPRKSLEEIIHYGKW